MKSPVFVRVCVATPPLPESLEHFFFYFLEKHIPLPPQPPDSSLKSSQTLRWGFAAHLFLSQIRGQNQGGGGNPLEAACVFCSIVLVFQVKVETTVGESEAEHP